MTTAEPALRDGPEQYGADSPWLCTAEDLQWWLDLAESLQWRFASTMAETPHDYVVRGKGLSEADFEKAVRVIRTFGQPGKFYDMVGIYLTDEDSGHKWWTMGAPLAQTIIINRASTREVYGTQDAPVTDTGRFTMYDALSTGYDDLYQSQRAREENQAVRQAIIKHFGAYAPTTLDLGCGTGLTLDLGITAPGLFTGVDESRGMLNELIRKHPRAGDIHAARAEEVVPGWRGEGRQYELVLSLFGSPSHIEPGTIEDAASMASEMAVFMHYRPGYLPGYYRGVEPEQAEPSRKAAAGLPHARTWRMNDFEVTVVER